MSNTINPTQGYEPTSYENNISGDSSPRNVGTGTDTGVILDPQSEDDGFLVAGDNPVLEESSQSWDPSKSGGFAIASFGSAYMALITEMSAEQRQQTRDLKAMETEQLVESIKDQAKKLHTKAVFDLVGGLVSGVASIGSGALTAGMVTTGMKKNPMSDTDMNALQTLKPKQALSIKAQAKQAQSLGVTTKAQGFSSALSGAGTLASSGFGYASASTDVASKELEAEIERTRAMQESLDMQAEALLALIQKAISTQDAIQQNMNQTRQRILG